MREIFFNDFIKLNRGFDLPNQSIVPGPNPVVASSTIKDFHKEFKVVAPGVVTGRSGSLGTVQFVRRNFWPLNTSLYVKNFKGNDPLFVSYFLRAMHLENFNSGAGVPTLNQNHLHRLRIRIPAKVTQQKIAAILSAYDDLIANNQRRITLLERMSEDIYREWFVRLRFPGYGSVKVEKGIPEHWHFDVGAKFFGHVKGKSYGGNELSDNPLQMPFITLKSFERGGGYRSNGLKHYSGVYKPEQVVRQGDIVMAVTDMTQNREVVGRVARVPSIGEKGAVISLDVIKLTPKTISSGFLYCFFRLSGFGDYIKGFANGTNVLHLKPDLVTQQKVRMPPNELQERFVEIVEPIYHQIDSINLAIAQLASTRDALLPRLISGKLAVDALDICYPPSMTNRA